MKKYYVYALIDPRDGQPFYIGKGCGKRCLQHEKDARKGCSGNAKKQSRILEILRAGLRVEVEIRSEHESEAAALAAEADAIESRRDSLTNIQPHGSPSSQEAKRQAAIDRTTYQLSRLAGFEDWCAAEPRSEFAKAMYRIVADSLQKCVADPALLAKEAVVVNGRIELRY